ncbi:MAG: ATP-dependent DNA helicase RecG [Collinsella phocaeensis]
MAPRIAAPAVSARMSRADVLHEDVSRLKYVSGAREEALRRLGIESVGDLLCHIPRRYLDFTHAVTIESAPIGSVSTIVGTVDRVSEKRPRPRLVITEVFLVDETGVLQVAFFKQPWLSRDIKRGDRLAVMGKVEFAYGFKQMSAPLFERLDANRAAGIVPVHPVSEGISVAWMRRIASVAIGLSLGAPDPLPAPLRARRRLMSSSMSLRAIHFPTSMGERELARRRLAYEETLVLQLGLRLRNDSNLLGVPAVGHTPGGHVAALRSALPFRLSEEQDAAVVQILRDMRDGGRIMNRLLLGDVGTGKTAVASFALACAADTGTQACVMAPTGILAQQYAVKVAPVLEGIGVSCALLTGATPAVERARLLERLAAGDIDVLFGTHAVLTEDVVFPHLSLVVIDEQHRFGVGQRNVLRAKGPGADLLVMSATPIPRTLALSLYGDLDSSVIRHRPVPGAGVTTRVLNEGNRDIAYGAIREAIGAGQRAYVVCPLVADRDDADELEDVPAPGQDGVPRAPLHSVEGELAHLEVVFPEACVAALHGRMSAVEKDATIEAFRQGAIDILVSTTVVEVGVDVPEATVMLIENGERFGLATLHQLRGRVGRGARAGTCYVIAQGAGRARRKTPSMERLEALEATSDGFELAEMDLRLRHEGEILGLRQHGAMSLRFVDLDADTDIIESAHDDAIEILAHEATLSAPALMPLRHCVIDRYGDVFKEVSGG